MSVDGHVSPPVFLALRFDPLINQWISVFPLVDEVGQPDVVIEARRLPRDTIGIYPDDLSDLAVAVVAMAQTTDLDAGFPGHQSTALEDRVARLDQPGVGTYLLHVPRHV